MQNSPLQRQDQQPQQLQYHALFNKPYIIIDINIWLHIIIPMLQDHTDIVTLCLTSKQMYTHLHLDHVNRQEIWHCKYMQQLGHLQLLLPQTTSVVENLKSKLNSSPHSAPSNANNNSHEKNTNNNNTSNNNNEEQLSCCWYRRFMDTIGNGIGITIPSVVVSSSNNNSAGSNSIIVHQLKLANGSAAVAVNQQQEQLHRIVINIQASNTIQLALQGSSGSNRGVELIINLSNFHVNFNGKTYELPSSKRHLIRPLETKFWFIITASTRAGTVNIKCGYGIKNMSNSKNKRNNKQTNVLVEYDINLKSILGLISSGGEQQEKQHVFAGFKLLGLDSSASHGNNNSNSKLYIDSLQVYEELVPLPSSSSCIPSSSLIVQSTSNASLISTMCDFLLGNYLVFNNSSNSGKFIYYNLQYLPLQYISYTISSNEEVLMVVVEFTAVTTTEDSNLDNESFVIVKQEPSVAINFFHQLNNNSNTTNNSITQQPSTIEMHLTSISTVQSSSSIIDDKDKQQSFSCVVIGKGTNAFTSVQRPSINAFRYQHEQIQQKQGKRAEERYWVAFNYTEKKLGYGRGEFIYQENEAQNQLPIDISSHFAKNQDLRWNEETITLDSIGFSSWFTTVGDHLSFKDIKIKLMKQ